MPISIFLTMLSYMLISSFTPGPGNILALNTTTKCGWKKSKILILGICCGYGCVQLICTLAVFSLNTVLSPALVLLKYVGSVYMIWLGIKIIKSKPNTEDTNITPSFYTGFLLQLVNVKIYFYITTLLTGYLTIYYKSLPQLLMAGLVVVFIGSIANITWGILGV